MDPLVGKFGSLHIHLHVGIVFVLVKLQDFLTVIVDLFLAQGIPGLGCYFLPNFCLGDGIGTFDEDFSDRRAPLQKNGHLEPPGNRFGKDTRVGNASCCVEGLDVLFYQALIVRSPRLGG